MSEFGPLPPRTVTQESITQQMNVLLNVMLDPPTNLNDLGAALLSSLIRAADAGWQEALYHVAEGENHPEIVEAYGYRTPFTRVGEAEVHYDDGTSATTYYEEP